MQLVALADVVEEGLPIGANLIVPGAIAVARRSAVPTGGGSQIARPTVLGSVGDKRLSHTGIDRGQIVAPDFERRAAGPLVRTTVSG